MNASPSTSWMSARRTRFGLYAVLYTLIVIAIVSGVDYLTTRYNKSYDTTTTKKFTLSDQTTKIAKNLKQDMTITYWDKASGFQGAHDLLDRYKNLSPKIDVQYMDADKKITEAKAAGVKTYGTIFINVGARQAEAKSLTEEEVTGAMVRALKGGERTACFLLGLGEHSLEDSGRDGFSRVKSLLEANNYKTETIKELEKPEIPKDCTILVIGGPRSDYTGPIVDSVKKYVEGGGHALIMLDPPLKFGQTEIAENQALADVLAGWGVTLDKDLVLDLTSQGVGLGPEMPLVVNYESQAIVRDMKEVPTIFPISRSLEVKNGDHTTVEKLFSTTEDSFATMNLSSAEIRPGKTDKKGPLVLGAAGTYNSGAENGNGRFVVTGGSSWATNGAIGLAGNRNLFLNMMAWLSADEDLISIRPKEPEDRRLNMTARQMTMMFYETIVFLPLLIVLAGVGIWWRRR
jgi:ABC-type uncharacterized transport system involved in gliding motility auxiliary subunit